ncbi:hypothetical protein ACJIZ3_023357 [Penstemon smallii]|uniref:Uncharacterized protein n=1 Tax=Penstemon smallii TaxID=265156 RepID=A0ABD3TQ72_9LAMI
MKYTSHQSTDAGNEGDDEHEEVEEKKDDDDIDGERKGVEDGEVNTEQVNVVDIAPNNAKEKTTAKKQEVYVQASSAKVSIRKFKRNDVQLTYNDVGKLFWLGIKTMINLRGIFVIINILHQNIYK